MSGITSSIVNLIDTFSKYAGKGGDPHTLSKAELKELLQNELADLLGKTNDKEAVDRIFNELDTNKDNSVNFEEFGRMVFCLTMACHEFFISKKQ